MKTSILFSFVLLVFGISACGTTQVDIVNDDTEIPSAELTVNFDDYPSDPVNIEGLSINGNVIALKVSFSGGCEEHEFKLVGLSAISKSIPPQRQVRLSHNGNGDNCREFITEEIFFNIYELGYKPGEAIILELKGWNEGIEYVQQAN